MTICTEKQLREIKTKDT